MNNHPEQRKNTHVRKTSDRHSGATRKRAGYAQRTERSFREVAVACDAFLKERGLYLYWS